MQVSEIVARVGRHLSVGYETILGDAGLLADFLGYCTDAQSTILGRGDWQFLFAETDLMLTPGVDRILLPPDLAALQPAADPFYIHGGRTRPQYIGINEMLHKRSELLSSAGWPIFWTLLYNAAEHSWLMLLWPTPGEAVPLRFPYRRQPPPLVDLGQTPDLPEPMHRTLLYGAMAEAQEQYEGIETGSQRAKFVAALEQDWAIYGSIERNHRPMQLRSPESAARAADVFGAELNPVYSVQAPGSGS